MSDGRPTVERLKRTATASDIEGLTDLFERYRVHYGQAADPLEAGRWLQRNVANGLLEAFVARSGEEHAGFALTMDVPGSLRLGHYWQIRDLFVVPHLRRRGVGRAILENIREAALAVGAMRLVLQTEDDNLEALRLYQRLGFTEVTGYRGLMLPLVADDAT